MTTIFSNGKVFTGQAGAKVTDGQSLVIQNDRITFIGPRDNESVRLALRDGATEYDLQGRTLAPGFIDSHMHILLFGQSLLAINLDGCRDLDEIRTTIKNGVQQRPDAKRIHCQGWMHSMTDSKALASMIDDLDTRPIFIYAKDLHSAWCNTAALQELGVQDMPDPEGGQILRDEQGNATGLLSENAALKIVWPHIANVTTDEENMNYVREAVKAYIAAGYTGIVELATEEQNWNLMKRLRDIEGLPIRVAAHWLIKPSKTTDQDLAQVDRAIELHKQYNMETSPDFRIVGIKLICDGVVDACTASLRESYTSTGTNCDPIWSPDRLRPVVEKADRAGLQCALHAIGDQTVRNAIDVIEAVGTPGNRHRIEHLELTSPEDALRLGKLGITASVQPVHSDPAIFGAWPKLIGEHRCGRAFAYKEFQDGGATLAFGTDSPTAPHLPLPNLYNATTRRSARRPEMTTTVNEHFKVSLEDALTAASAGGAYSCFADRMVGTLEVGKKADLVVLDIEWAPDQLLKGSVLETWFDGRRVFKRE